MENQRALVYLDHLLSKLEPDKREVFILYELEELTIAEVAEAVGCALSTAYARLSAARQKIAAADRRERMSRRLK